MNWSDLDFEKAYKIIKKDENEGMAIPDPFLYKEYDNYLGKLVKIIIDDLENNKYSPNDLFRIDMPKDNFTVRPMSCPILADWLVYQAIVLKIQESYDFSQNTFSYSLSKYNSQNKEKINGWKEFESKTKSLIALNEYKYVIKTDISTYFENISIDKLNDQINNFCKNQENICSMLITILKKWSERHLKGYGIPQGLSASLFLGDIYLNVVDKAMSSQSHITYFRFMDDIRIFVKDEVSARKILLKLTCELRDLKLALNAKKTEIISIDKADSVLLDENAILMNKIDEILNSGNQEWINQFMPLLIELYEKSFSSTNKFNARHLRFTLRRFEKLAAAGYELDEDYIIHLLLKYFRKYPSNSATICKFLTLFPNNSLVINFLLKELQSEYNIYEWQEIQILRTLLHMNIKIHDIPEDFLLRKFRDKNLLLSRAYYALILGKLGDASTRELLKKEYSPNDNPYTQGAIIIATQELGLSSRNRFYHSAKQNNQHSEVMVDFVKTLHEPRYVEEYNHDSMELYTYER